METKSPYLPSVFFKLGQQIVHFIAIPVFFYLFMIFYKPFSLEWKIEFSRGSFAFNAAIITAIIFLVLVITRLILWGLRNTTQFKRRTYLLWCMGEVVICSLFISLYLFLISGGQHSFIDLVPVCLAELAAVLMFPYIILTLLLESDVMARYASEENLTDTRLRFYDERHNLKFITDPASLLYVESNENYCEIYYTENGGLNHFLLRSTLKSLEEICAPCGIIRCHRSYLVNAKRIKILRKEPDGFIRAELDQGGTKPVPVTPRYYDSVSRYL